MFSLFFLLSRCFSPLVVIINRSLPPLLLSAKIPPSLFFFSSGVFPSHAHIYVCIYIYINITEWLLPPPPLRVLSFRWCWLSLSRSYGRGSAARPSARCFPERLPSVAGVAPSSLGYLLLFLSAKKQNGGLLFLLLWYGGRVGGTATLGVKGRREEGGWRGGRCLRRCSGLSGNRFRALSAVFVFNLCSRGQWLFTCPCLQSHTARLLTRYSH